MALNGLLCADVPLRTYTLTHTHVIGSEMADIQGNHLEFEQLLWVLIHLTLDYIQHGIWLWHR